MASLDQIVTKEEALRIVAVSFFPTNILTMDIRQLTVDQLQRLAIFIHKDVANKDTTTVGSTWRAIVDRCIEKDIDIFSNY